MQVSGEMNATKSGIERACWLGLDGRTLRGRGARAGLMSRMPSPSDSAPEQKGFLGRTIDGVRERIRLVRQRIRRELTWSRVYRATSYARSALWIVPLLAVLLVIMVAPLVRVID